MNVTTAAPSRINDLVFVCYYNDNDVDYYTLSLTLLQYANIMESQIQQSIDIMDKQIHDRYTDTHEYEQETGKINNFKICSIFNDKQLDSDCAIYSKDATIDAQYIAIGTFDIITSNDIMTFKHHLTEIMESPDFIDVFNTNMNSALTAVMHRRRRLLQSIFTAIYIHVGDNMNDAQNHQIAHESEENNQSILNMVLVFAVILVVVIVFICAFVWDRKKNQHRPPPKRLTMMRDKQDKEWDMNPVIASPEYETNAIDNEVVLINADSDDLRGILKPTTFLSNPMSMNEVNSISISISHELLNQSLPQQPTVDPYFDIAPAISHALANDALANESLTEYH